MKGKRKASKIMVLVSVMILLGVNVYQWVKVKWYTEVLTSEVYRNLHKFASTAGKDYSEPSTYVEAYAAIESAFNASSNLPEDKEHAQEEYNSLNQLLQELKSLMVNDKEKVQETFKNPDGSELISNIADDFNDKDSISKMLELLK